jgi:hypothetical protein
MESVQVGASVGRGVTQTAGIHFAGDVAQLFEVGDDGAYSSRLHVGVAGQGDDRGPGPTVAVVVGDPDEDEFVGRGETLVDEVEGLRHALNGHVCSCVIGARRGKVPSGAATPWCTTPESTVRGLSCDRRTGPPVWCPFQDHP